MLSFAEISNSVTDMLRGRVEMEVERITTKSCMGTENDQQRDISVMQTTCIQTDVSEVECCTDGVRLTINSRLYVPFDDETRPVDTKQRCRLCFPQSKTNKIKCPARGSSRAHPLLLLVVSEDWSTSRLQQMCAVDREREQEIYFIILIIFV